MGTHPSLMLLVDNTDSYISELPAKKVSALV